MKKINIGSFYGHTLYLEVPKDDDTDYNALFSEYVIDLERRAMNIDDELMPFPDRMSH